MGAPLSERNNDTTGVIRATVATRATPVRSRRHSKMSNWTFSARTSFSLLDVCSQLLYKPFSVMEQEIVITGKQSQVWWPVPRAWSASPVSSKSSLTPPPCKCRVVSTSLPQCLLLSKSTFFSGEAVSFIRPLK